MWFFAFSQHVGRPGAPLLPRHRTPLPIRMFHPHRAVHLAGAFPFGRLARLREPQMNHVGARVDELEQ